MDPLQLILARNFSIWNFAAGIQNEADAIAAAKAWLLFPSQTPNCPRCRSPLNKEAKSTYKLDFRWRCRRAGCKKIISPLAKTFFERSNVSFLDTLRLIFHFLSKEKV